MIAQYNPIRRNKDEKGIILTYTAIVDDREFEVNTLREAKRLAIIIEDNIDQAALINECEDLLKYLKSVSQEDINKKIDLYNRSIKSE